MREDQEARQLLVDLLHEAAQLEHCLLNAYLYTACSIKTMPQEFADVDGKENRRRAIQHERARGWKQSILAVSHEEMLHLHYVQCLLRALDEAPNFSLPSRDESGNWIIPNWKARIGGADVEGGRGVVVPVDPLTDENIRKFVLYESTDSLQDNDPFGPQASDLFNRLHQFELDLQFESMLYQIEDEVRRNALKEKLKDLYTTLTPLPADQKLVLARVADAVAEVGLPPLEELKFQSIADFYMRGILPLYEEAFDFGWVKHNNRDLNNEMNGFQAGEGFLPIGPVYRSKNFTDFSKGNISNPLRNYKHVRDIVTEIVEEGEGASKFEARSEEFLQLIGRIGTRAYVEALIQFGQSWVKVNAPEWFVEGENLRNSHLYRFAMIMAEMKQEQELSAESGVTFEASRAPISVANSVRLSQLADELPSQFNSAYLVMLVWLSRMYEIPDWEADKSRRGAIEMLASWPLMSLAIRPFLELASFFPVDRKQMFRLDADALPLLPIHAQQLLHLYTSAERSEEINERMDYLGMRVLSGVAAWAASQQDAVEAAELNSNTKEMILARLGGLAHLDEYQRQFPFRVHGGYSNTMPDLTYQQEHPDGDRFAEDPSTFTQTPLYQDTLALRIRFSGRGLVQLATDPDPPTDEAGCSGTHMLHAADGDRRFDRSLVWQPEIADHAIIRQPAEKLPALGVNCTDVTLVVTNGTASAGYVPLPALQSTGAVNTSGGQLNLQVQGFLDLLKLTPQEILGENRQIRLDLKEKDGRRPFLNGDNHLVWKDGEPIDPFILAVLSDPPAKAGKESQPELIFQREIYNEGLKLLEMSPLQRVETARGPVGFDFNVNNVPDWARGQMNETELQLLQGPPTAYLKQRALVLADALSEQFDAHCDFTQQDVDAAVSYAERMQLISMPLGTTVGWLKILLNYGHTVSGNLKKGKGENPIFSAFAEKTQLQLGLAKSGNRNESNARWVVQYTQGIMDTDALSNLVYGELYVPVTVQGTGKPIELTESWTFPRSMQAAVAEYAARFTNPYWANFTVHGNVRTATLPDGTVITETLQEQTDNSYTYTMTGIQGVTGYQGAFVLSQDGDRVKLDWKVSFQCDNPQTIVSVVSIVAGAAQQMTGKMTGYFSPSV